MTVCNYGRVLKDFRGVDGGGPLVGKGVSDVTDPYDTGLSVGFNGNSFLSGLPSGTATRQFSLSVWVNFDDGVITGVTPASNQGLIFQIYDAAPAATNTNMFIDFLPTIVGSSPFGFTASSTTPTYSGWNHLMYAWRIFGTSALDSAGGTIPMRGVIYLNDTVLFNNTEDKTYGGGGTTEFNYALSHSGGDIKAIGADEGSTTATSCVKAALSEYVCYRSYVDWTKKSNRYLFHDFINGTYVAKDLGATGLTPGLGTPYLYLTGGASGFIKNRSTVGGTLTVNGDALISVSSTPF